MRGGAPTSEQQPGLLHLAFGRDWRGRSSLRARRQRFPLRTTQPLYLDPELPGMAFVYVQNPTGGVFAGDELALEVVAGAGVNLHVTTQSATKLYRMEAGEAHQELSFALAEQAYVEHVPDALIPQAGTRYRQDTRVELAAGAMFVGLETIAPAGVPTASSSPTSGSSWPLRSGTMAGSCAPNGCSSNRGGRAPIALACSEPGITSCLCSRWRRVQTWTRWPPPSMGRWPSSVARRGSCRAARG